MKYLNTHGFHVNECDCRRTKKKDIYVISTLKRPVPLEHNLYANKELFKIVGANETKLNGARYGACYMYMKLNFRC